jgi:hypothetical protein
MAHAWERLMGWFAMRRQRHESREAASAVEYDRKMELMERRLGELGAAVDVIQGDPQASRPIVPSSSPREDAGR